MNEKPKYKLAQAAARARARLASIIRPGGVKRGSYWQDLRELRKYVPHFNKRGKFAGWRRDPVRIRESKKARLHRRRAAKAAA